MFKHERSILMRTKRKCGAFLPLIAGGLLLAGSLLHPKAEPDPGVGAFTQTAITPTKTQTEAPGETTAEQIVASFASAHDLSMSAWSQSLIDLLDRNPETRDFVLGYPEEHNKTHAVDLSEYGDFDTVPLFLQWDQRWGYIRYGTDVAGITGCGPVCLSMVTCYLTGDPSYSPDEMIRFALENDYCVPGNGSSWTLISEGGRQLGLDVTELPLVESIVMDHLQAGHPIICIMGPGDFTDSGHFIVLTGCEDGKIRINDPNSREKSARLWEYAQIESQIDNLWVLERG